MLYAYIHIHNRIHTCMLNTYTLLYTSSSSRPILYSLSVSQLLLHLLSPLLVMLVRSFVCSSFSIQSGTFMYMKFQKKMGHHNNDDYYDDAVIIAYIQIYFLSLGLSLARHLSSLLCVAVSFNNDLQIIINLYVTGFRRKFCT